MEIEQEIKSDNSKRKFIVKILKFNNGYFVSVSEDELRIGAVSVSLSISNRSSTAKVIPEKYDQVFIDTLSSRISLMKNGICIVSLFIKNKLQLEDMKLINDKILSAIEGE